MVGSLTKVFACPGLRVGYVLADPSFIELLRRRQPEWSLNGLAAAALPELLDELDLAGAASAISVLRAQLRDVLEDHGLVTRPSDANWLLVEYAGLREALAPSGIIVRDCTSFGLPGVTRIAVPDESGLERLRSALDTLAPTNGATTRETET